MKRYTTPICILFLFAAMTSFASEPSQLIPGPPAGWQVVSEIRMYGPDDLYDYIDGGAELFLSYGMLSVASQIVSSGENEVRIEVFDMGKGENAFGVFSHTRTRDEHLFGQGSQGFTGTLIFWKGSYYITLTANDANEEIDTALDYYAKTIDAAIEQTSSLPGIVGLLPEENLVEDGYIFFHHYIWQNAYHFLSGDNILLITPETPCVLARYKGANESKLFLLLISYPDTERAIEAESLFRKEFLASGEECVMIEDESWWLLRREAGYLIVVMNAPEKILAEKLANQTTSNIEHQPTR